MHMRQVGIKVSESLIAAFDSQVMALNKDVDTFESDLAIWENDIRDELGGNKAAVKQFDTDVG